MAFTSNEVSKLPLPSPEADVQYGENMIKLVFTNQQLAQKELNNLLKNRIFPSKPVSRDSYILQKDNQFIIELNHTAYQKRAMLAPGGEWKKDNTQDQDKQNYISFLDANLAEGYRDFNYSTQTNRRIPAQRVRNIGSCERFVYTSTANQFRIYYEGLTTEYIALLASYGGVYQTTYLGNKQYFWATFNTLTAAECSRDDLFKKGKKACFGPYEYKNNYASGIYTMPTVSKEYRIYYGDVSFQAIQDFSENIDKLQIRERFYDRLLMTVLFVDNAVENMTDDAAARFFLNTYNDKSKSSYLKLVEIYNYASQIPPANFLKEIFFNEACQRSKKLIDGIIGLKGTINQAYVDREQLSTESYQNTYGEKQAPVLEEVTTTTTTTTTIEHEQLIPNFAAMGLNWNSGAQPNVQIVSQPAQMLHSNSYQPFASNSYPSSGYATQTAPHLCPSDNYQNQASALNYHQSNGYPTQTSVPSHYSSSGGYQNPATFSNPYQSNGYPTQVVQSQYPSGGVYQNLPIFMSNPHQNSVHQNHTSVSNQHQSSGYQTQPPVSNHPNSFFNNQHYPGSGHQQVQTPSAWPPSPY